MASQTPLIEAQRCWDEDDIIKLLADETDDVLRWVGHDQIGSRPDCCRLDPNEEDLIERVRLTLFMDGRPIGFSECAVVRRQLVQDHRICRICMDEFAADSDSSLLNGCCACRGTQRFICRECLVRAWRRHAEQLQNPSNLTCDVCKQPYTGKAQKVLTESLESDVRRRELSRPELPEPGEEMNLCVSKIAVATKMWDAGRHQAAADGFWEVIERLSRLEPLGKNYELTARHNLSLVLYAQGRPEEALNHVQVARNGFFAIFGPNHLLTLKATHNEAMILDRGGHKDRAKVIYEDVLRQRQVLLGMAHIDTLKTSCNLGQLLHELGEADRSETMLRETLANLERVVGRCHPLTLVTLQNLSMVLACKCVKEKKTVSLEAEHLGREACEGRRRNFGDDHPNALEGRRALGLLLTACGKFEEAEELLRQALSGMERVLGFEHPTTKETLIKLSDLLGSKGDTSSVAQLLDEHKNRQGVSGAKEGEPPKPDRGTIVLVILNIYVARCSRGMGVGRRGVQHWRALANELRASWIEVCPHRNAVSAQEFFKACGFVEAAESEVAALGRQTVLLKLML